MCGNVKSNAACGGLRGIAMHRWVSDLRFYVTTNIIKNPLILFAAVYFQSISCIFWRADAFKLRREMKLNIRMVTEKIMANSIPTKRIWRFYWIRTNIFSRVMLFLQSTDALNSPSSHSLCRLDALYKKWVENWKKGILPHMLYLIPHFDYQCLY